MTLTADKKKVFLTFILFSCLFYLDKVLLGSYASVLMTDTFEIEFIRYKAIGDLILRHGLFQWFPNSLGGMPAYAYQVTPYYMLSLLSSFIPQWFTYSIIVISLMAIAGFGMFWLLKDYLGIKAPMAFAAGVIFSLYTQVQANPQSQITLFNYVSPFFFMLIFRSSQGANTFRSRAVISIAILFIILLSYPVLTLSIYFMLPFLIILLFNSQKKASKNLLMIKVLLVWLGYIFLFTPVIYGLYSYIPFSNRVYGQGFNGSIASFLSALKHPALLHLFTAMKGSGVFLLLIGFIPLIFYSNKARRAFFLFLLPLVLAAFFTKPALSFVHKTIFIKMDLDHFIWLLPFGSIVFLAVGFQELISRKFPKIIYCLCFLLAGGFYLWLAFKKGLKMDSINFLVPLSIAAFYFYKKAGSLKNNKIAYRLKAPLFIAAIVFFILALAQFRALRFRAGYGDEYFPYKGWFENTSVFKTLKEEEGISPFRMCSLFYSPYLAKSYGIETIDGKTPLYSKYFKEYVKGAVSVQLKTALDHAVFDNSWYNIYLYGSKFSTWGSVLRADKIEDIFNMPLLLSTNVKYIVSDNYYAYLDKISEEIINDDQRGSMLRIGFMDRILKKINPAIKDTYRQRFFIYKLKDTFERGYLAKEPVFLASDGEVLSELSRQSTKELREKVFFSKGVSFYMQDGSKARAEEDKLNIAYYGPDKIVFKGEVSASRMLVVTNNYHPSWNADINGKKTKIYRANHSFQAIVIPDKGEFTAAFTYDDPWLLKAHMAMPLGIVLVFTAVFYRGKKDEDTLN